MEEFHCASRFSAAIHDGAVVGFASGVHYLHPDKPRPEMWINEVAVAPAWRGRGVGKAVVAGLVRHARTTGCTEAWVLTEPENGPAMGLYASLGGKESDEGTFLFSFPLD